MKPSSSPLPSKLGRLDRDSPLAQAGSLTIDLWCNAVAGGWEPEDLETGLGGGEEALVLWSAALSEVGHQVRVFRNGREPWKEKHYPGAEFLPHGAFDPFQPRDVLVSFKSPHPWRLDALADYRIHWSSDIEPPWPTAWAEKVDAFVLMSEFQRSAMPWLRKDRAEVFPLGFDRKHLDAHKAPRVPGLAIYCSSPDRGLVTLLRDWPRLRAAHPGLTLEVYYGWQRYLACGAGSPAALQFKQEVEQLLKQPGISFRGQVSRDEMARAYWRAEFWMLPLNRPESELFCLNAIKAIHCGATPVVNRLGALQETATTWIDYKDFLHGGKTVAREGICPGHSWRDLVKTCWEPLFKDLKCNS